VETNVDVVSAEVLEAAYHLHKGLGPGLLESVYEQLLAKDLARRGLRVERQRVVPFEYDGLVFEAGLKVDLLVNECLVVEIKAVEKLLPVHERQTYTYPRLMDLQVALLLNFGAPLMKDGIHRIVNGYRPTPQSRLRIKS
jgi:GxxExxY protein